MNSIFSSKSRSTRNIIVQPSQMSFTRPFLVLHIILILVWSIAPTTVDATCYPYHRFLNCLNDLPTKEELESLGSGGSVTLRTIDADFRVDVPAQEDVYSVTSLQIQNSNIRSIAPYFFWQFSSGALEALVINAVNGSFQLDGNTLGKLENVIKSIRVNGYRIRDISYFANLKRLNTLSLGRTQLTSLPSNFGQLLSRLTNVDLSTNELTTFPWDALARRIRDVEFQKIRLPDNPWHCDCSLQPLMEVPDEYLDKIVGFHCATPKDVTGYTLREFRKADLCKKPPIKEPVDAESSVGDTFVPPDAEGQARGVLDSSGPGIQSGGADASAELAGGDVSGTGAPTAEVASAGLSTEVIAVIAAIVIVVVIVLIAVIAFKVRQSNHRRQQQAARKQPSQKSNSYCAVIEHPSPPRGGPAGTGPGASKSGAMSSASNNYGRDVDNIERQPLAPGYRDNRL